MVKADEKGCLLSLSKEENRIVGLVQADRNFTDKRDAIKFIIKKYSELVKNIKF
jgi:hypothetical protein